MLNLLDKLVFWYAHKRYEKQMDAYNASQPEIELKSAKTLVKEGNVITEALMAHPNILIIAEDMAKLLDQCKAKNYIVFDFMPRLASGAKSVEVTVRWSSKLTPAQRVTSLEKRIVELERSLDKVSRDHQLSAAVADIRFNIMGKMAELLERNGLGDQIAECERGNNG